MGKQPAVVIVARHGARLDQVDKQWQTTAAKPYDPPLTYGGWIQCQTLGARIASELRSLDTTAGSKSEENVSSLNEPRKRRKVIIHSSPYLRCIQTSIAVSAGLNQAQPFPRSSIKQDNRFSLPQSPLVQDSSKQLVSDTTTGDEQTNELTKVQSKSVPDEAQLRIDPFLGEWLSPSYFEHSSAPPPSAELVAEAKACLKTPAEAITGADLSSPPIYEFSPVEWEEKEAEATSTPSHEKTGLRAMAALGHSMAKRPRNVSFGTDVSNGNRASNKAKRTVQIGYSPPVPTYSIAPQDRIPIGFVAHARDACINVDFGWDSAKPPLDWGDGGPFDEEWGSMHRRFGHGLRRMLGYYESNSDDLTEEDDEEDLILILVTHQAGCNALIRLMTGAPALHDVGTASLTMAVRKQGLRRLPSVVAVSPTRRRGSLDLGIADDFDMKIIASTEHLRAGSNPLGLNSPRLGKSPAFASRRAVGADSPEGFSIGDPLSWKPSSNHGLGRSLSQRSFPIEGSPSSATGLWRRGSQYSRDESSDSFDPGLSPSLNSGTTTDSIPEELWGASDTDQAKESKVEVAQLPVRSASQRGLWGGESAIRRERSPGKRRWTAVDRSP